MKQPPINEIEAKKPKERKPKKSVLTKKDFEEMRHHDEEIRTENERIDKSLKRQFGQERGSG